MRLAPAIQAIFVLLAATAVYSYVSAARDGERRRRCANLCYLSPNYAAENRLAPEFDLPTLSGGRVRFSELRGKTVVLNFWTTSCPPCLEEMPSLAELAQAVEDRRDVVVVTVTTDDTMDEARSTLKSVLGAEAPFLTAHDPEGAVVTGKYGTKLYPESWIIDPRGIIVSRFDGKRDWTSPLIIDYVTTLDDPLRCDIEFAGGRPVGSGEGICASIVD